VGSRESTSPAPRVGILRRLAPFAVAVLVSVVVLFVPASATPPALPGVDKLVHLALFGVLALTGRLGRLPVGGLATALVAYAAGSEVLQGLLPIGRSADPVDALVDVVGVALGLVAARRFLRAGDQARTVAP
jgi:VanZ family protein